MSEIFIDWSKAPEGTTHAYVAHPQNWIDGRPCINMYWEKNVSDQPSMAWNGVDWEAGLGFFGSNSKHRIARPTAPFENTTHLSVELGETNYLKPFEDGVHADVMFSPVSETNTVEVTMPQCASSKFDSESNRHVDDRSAQLPNASNFLKAGLKHMDDRASTYDKPTGERSMGKCVQAFNAITGLSLTEEQGWLLLGILKMTRSQQGNFKADNYEDEAAYAALRGECAARDRTIQPAAPTTPAVLTVSDDELKGKLSKLSRDFGRDAVLEVFKPFNIMCFTTDVHKLSDHQRISMYLECDRIRNIREVENKS